MAAFERNFDMHLRVSWKGSEAELVAKMDNVGEIAPPPYIAEDVGRDRQNAEGNSRADGAT